MQRTAILSNEKYRGVRLELSPNSVVLQANNPEQEEAVETLEVEYSGDAMEIGFNVNYLLDALAAVDSEQVEFGVTDAQLELLDPRAGRRRNEVRRDADAPLARRYRRSEAPSCR